MSPSMLVNYTWNPLEDLHGSEHFLILIHLVHYLQIIRYVICYWNVRKANWTLFTDQYANPLNENCQLIHKTRCHI